MQLLKIFNYMHKKILGINMKVTLALIVVLVLTLFTNTHVTLRTISRGSKFTIKIQTNKHHNTSIHA